MDNTLRFFFFSVICETSDSSSRLGRYGLEKLESPKSGQETPSWLQVGS
jgi:hypothetical protein